MTYIVLEYTHINAILIKCFGQSPRSRGIRSHLNPQVQNEGIFSLIQRVKLHTFETPNKKVNRDRHIHV